MKKKPPLSGWKAFYEKSLSKAEKLDASGLHSLSSKALEKLIQQQERIDHFGRNIKDLAGLVSAFATGKYTKVPWRIVVASAAALLYFINPFDFIPDVLIGIGFLDDLSVAAFVVQSFSHEIEQYREWKELQKQFEEG